MGIATKSRHYVGSLRLDIHQFPKLRRRHFVRRSSLGGRFHPDDYTESLLRGSETCGWCSPSEKQRQTLVIFRLTRVVTSVNIDSLEDTSEYRSGKLAASEINQDIVVHFPLLQNLA